MAEKAPEQVDVTEVALDQAQVDIEARRVSFTFSRDKSGQLFKTYFGMAADIQLINTKNRVEHPLT
jgi:hypothetical protein